MFAGRSNNNSSTVNTNTKLFQSYSDACMITIGAWNLQLSLKFHPAKGVNADGIRQYAQDNSEIISTSLTVDKATTLLKGLKEEDIEKAIVDGKPASASVDIGSGENKKILTVGFDGTNTYASIAVGVSEQNTAPETNNLKHIFKKTTYLAGYDVTTGTGVQKTVEADYQNFIKKIESIYELAPVTAHAINHNNAIKQNFANSRQSSAQTNNYQAATSMGSMEEFPFSM